MTFLDDLAAADPVREKTPYGDARAAALIADITAGRVVAPPPPPAPSRRPWLVGGIAVAAAATLAGVLIIPPVLRHDAQISPGLPVPTSSATPTRAATPTSSTQYWKTVTTGVYRSGASDPSGSVSAQFAAPFTRESYTPVDPAKRSYDVVDLGAATLLHGSTTFPAPAARHTIVARPSPVRVPGAAGNWQTPGPTWADKMPRDVDALRSRLYQGVSGSSRADVEAFGNAVSAVTSPEVPTDLREALVKVIATIPGAKVGSEPVVVSGFQGTLVSISTTTDLPQLREVVFDPGTGWRYLDRTLVTNSAQGMAAGTVYDEVRMTGRVLVDEVPAEILAQTSGPCTPEHWSQGQPSGCDVGLPLPTSSGAPARPTP